MSAYDPLPRAIFGGLLEGKNAVRFIFMDEAGTSGRADETCRVVCGIIVHADEQLMRAEALLTEALQAVPDKFRDGFVFHAEELIHKKAYRDDWRLTDRLNLLKTVMGIPKRLKMTVAYGVMWSDAPHYVEFLKKNESDHLMAFVHCLCVADKWIRENAGPEEIATIVSEQSDMQRHLREVPRTYRDNPVRFSPANTEQDIARGYNAQDGVYRVSRIRNSVLFVGKEDEDLVWLADACAYGLKRYIAKQEYGEEFGQAILAGPINHPDTKISPGFAGLGRF